MPAEQKKKSKKFLNKLHAKYYGKDKSKTKESKIGDALSKGPSRNELMLKAKAKGIKNFRIINKEELVEILKERTTHARIKDIVTGALTRWKNGWGSSKRKQKIPK